MPANLSNAELRTLINVTEDRFGSGPMPKAVGTLYKKMVRAVKKISTSSAKDKGKALQYWVCARLASLVGVSFVQSDDLFPIHSREMGQAGTDIVFRTSQVQSLLPFSFECKSTESLELPSTIMQVQNNTRPGTDWVIVHKRKSFRNPIVIMEWRAFEVLVKSKISCCNSRTGEERSAGHE